MVNNSIKYKIAVGLAVAWVVPLGVFAQSNNQVCSPVGYTIATINGVFTDDVRAKENRDRLNDRFDGVYNGEPLTVKYFYNPPHVNGIGDALKSIQQGLFDDEDIRDTDLLSMLTDASKQVKTQKLLLVPHSQGNFYANALRKNLADQIGGIAAKSIGIFGVANPATHMYDGGAWLTSKTDKVISTFVGHVPLRTILPIKETISFNDSDGDTLGHDFTKIYLKYKTPEIVAGIQSQLSKLQIDSGRREDMPCIDPPKITFIDRIDAVTLAILDKPRNIIDVPAVLMANLGIKTVVGLSNAGNFIGQNLFKGEIFVVKTTVNAVVLTAKITAKVAVWYVVTGADLFVETYHTGVTVAVWTYQTGSTLASVVYGTSVSFTNDKGNITATNKSAPVILATHNTPEAPSMPKRNAEILIPKIIQAQESGIGEVGQTSLDTAPTIVVEDLSVDSVKTSTSAPRLVFVGNFSSGTIEGSGGGGTSSAQVLGTSETTTVVPKETATTTEEVLTDNVDTANAAPKLSAPDCLQTLATEGCLLATTTVRFNWAAVKDADHYSMNTNGTIATTTELSFETTARDFSDYTFEIASVDKMGIMSSTTKKTISLATIPIAINEIAWMGTRASSNDEWIELKNNTNYTLDLSQWALEASDGTPYIRLTKIIAPHQYLLLERTRDANVIDVATHAKYTGALENTGEQLTLSHASTTLDQTPIVVNNKWAAGENSTSTRKTMERYVSKKSGLDVTNWGTWGNEIDIKNGTDAKGNEINGTPGARNSTTYLLNKGLDITSELTLSPDEDYYLITKPLTVTASSTFVLEPGVIIKFLYDTKSSEYPTLIVLGALHATGNAEKPVVFESYADNQQGRIVFMGDIATSTLEHVQIERAESVYVTGNARLRVSDSSFVNNYAGLHLGKYSNFINGKPVRVNEGGSVFINNTSFASTTREAIAAYDGSFVSVASSTVTNTLDSDAIGIYDSSLVMASSTVDAVKNGDGVGVYNGAFTMASSTIRNIADGDGVVVYDSILVMASSTISNINRYGVYLGASTSTLTNVKIENSVDGGISGDGGTVAIASSTILNTTDGEGVYFNKSIVSIASSTIRDVWDGDGIYLRNSTSTITNTVVENTVANEEGIGINVDGGKASIASSTISGFTQGAGIEVNTPIAPVVIKNSEITGNAVGLDLENGSAACTNVSVYNNDVNIIGSCSTGIPKFKVTAF